MKRFSLLIVLFATFVFNSCSTDDGPNFHYKTLRALEAQLPDSFELNQRYRITVTYERLDDCTFFEGFDVTSTDTTIRNVTVIGSVFTDRDCLPEPQEVEASFDFIVLHNQPYIFRFWEGKDENDEHQFFEITVPVN